MSRPIYEPSLPRKDAELGYGSDQLFRRPSPATGGSILEWYRAESTTDLAAAWTDLDWANPNNSGHDSGASPPTFAINGSANIVIAKAGAYSIEIGFQNLTLGAADTNTQLHWDVRRIAGARPWSFRSTTGDPSVLAVPVNLLNIDVTPDMFGEDDPAVHTHFVLLATAIAVNGACEIRVQTKKAVDNVDTADTTATYYVFVIRYGDAYEAA